MLINLMQLKKRHQLDIRGVIHIGAHHGQEYSDYKLCGIHNIVFIEPSPEAFKVLSAKMTTKSEVRLFNVACGSSYQEATMFTETANQGQSNSLLRPEKHTLYYPTIEFKGTQTVEVTPLDSILLDKPLYNMMNIDVQGYELEVLRGSEGTLPGIDYLYLEVNISELYEGCAKLSEIDNFLSDFIRLDTLFTGEGWGDAFYIRRSLL